MLLFALACVALAAFPTVYAVIATPPGTRYTGFQTNVDDHMVYAAWTWQAAHGALILFDNRFAVDPAAGADVPPLLPHRRARSPGSWVWWRR